MFKKSLAALLLGLSLPALSVSIETARGNVEIENTPQKIIVFDPGVLDSLNALEVEGVVGIPDFKTPYYKDAQSVGTLFEPDLEAIASLQPDLIIIAVRSASKYDSLSRLAPTIDLTLDNQNTFESAQNRLTELGKLFNKEEKAQSINEALQNLANEVKTLAEGQGKVLGILVNGPKLSLYGKQSRLGWIEPTLGLELIDKERDPNAKGHGNPISFEFVAESNPDWIFVVDRAAAIGQDLESAQSVLNTPLVQQTTAGQKEQIVFLDPRNIYITVGGPEATKNTLQEIQNALNK